MTAAKNVYALMLALVIVLSGCFGNAAPDTDGQSNNNTNMEPLIEVGSHSTTGGTPLYSPSSGEMIGYTGWNVTVYRAVADLDGNIMSAGWDFDLDGTIAIEWGAYGVPESYLIYENEIIKKYIGPLNQQLINEIKLLIK